MNPDMTPAEAIADILGHPDHANCRTTEAGPVAEAECIVLGLRERGFDVVAVSEVPA